MSELFGPIFVPDPLRDVVSGRAWLAAMLEAERALAAARGIEGRFDPADYDLETLAREGRRVGNPVEPLVRALRRARARGARRRDLAGHPRHRRDARRARRPGADRGRGRRAGDGLRATRRRAPRDGHAGTDAAAAGGADDVRSEGGGLARRRGLCRGAPQGLAASRLARRRRGNARAARRRRDRRAAGLRGRARPRRARRPLARDADARAGARGRAGRRRGRVREDRARRPPARTDGGGGGARPRRRLVDDAAQAKPRGAVLARACALRAHALTAGLHRRARARAGGRCVARRVGAAVRPARADRARRRSTCGSALEGLEVDAERMRANLRAEATSEGGADVAPEDYLGSAVAFVDRALARRRRG